MRSAGHHRAKRKAAFVLAGAACLALLTTTTPAANAAVPPAPRPDWNHLWSWAINNAAFDERGIAQVRNSTRDMVVIGRHNSHNGQEWTRAEIDSAKLSKWVLAYFAVGEAQRSEWYWRPEWNNHPPAWVIGQNPYWHNNVFAELWNGDWQLILHQTLDRIIDQGFDGAFLDVVDAYWYPGYPDGATWYNKWEAAMTVCALAEHARARNPNFKLVINNALDLFYMVPNYFNCIDGTVIEGLWWVTSDQPRDAFYFNQKRDELTVHQAAGKPIFALDYAPVWDRARMDQEARALGYIPYAAWFGVETPLPD